MVLLIDNYDSFSYNLYQMAAGIRPDIKVVRNDKISLDEIEEMNPDAIILSPGPGRPSDAGICEELIKRFSGKMPIFGVCLGHQAICEAFGGEITYAKELMHGKQSRVKKLVESKIFKGIEDDFLVARYHSLAAKEDNLPRNLIPVAVADDGEIMAVEHEKHNTFGLQFHPESIMTPYGKKMMENFFELIGDLDYDS